MDDCAGNFLPERGPFHSAAEGLAFRRIRHRAQETYGFHGYPRVRLLQRPASDAFVRKFHSADIVYGRDAPPYGQGLRTGGFVFTRRNQRHQGIPPGLFPQPRVWRDRSGPAVAGTPQNGVSSVLRTGAPPRPRSGAWLGGHLQLWPRTYAVPGIMEHFSVLRAPQGRRPSRRAAALRSEIPVLILGGDDGEECESEQGDCGDEHQYREYDEDEIGRRERLGGIVVPGELFVRRRGSACGDVKEVDRIPDEKREQRNGDDAAGKPQRDLAYAARRLPEDEIVNAEPAEEEREKSGGRFWNFVRRRLLFKRLAACGTRGGVIRTFFSAVSTEHIIAPWLISSVNIN